MSTYTHTDAQRVRYILQAYVASKDCGLNSQLISSKGLILQSAKPTEHFHQVLQISKILNGS